jgi:hypothetical protein
MEALKSSNSFHDPTSKWDETVMNFHIEEPRISNPTRYSEIYLNVADGTFSLVRNRDDHLATYSMDANNNPLVLLDGNEQIDEEHRSRYRLYPDRVSGYREFYRILYGLPMSLDFELIRKIDDMREAMFLDQKAMVIGIQWYEPVIKPYWKLYLDPATYRIIGIELMEKGKPGVGERIVFDGIVDYKGLQIPRMRHWYSMDKNVYLGSDIIIENGF